MDASDDPKSVAGSQSVSLDERKFEHETKARDRELAIKEREVLAKERELARSRWLNPTVLGLFAAAIGLIGNVIVASYNNRGAQKLERSRTQSSLILQAISTGNPEVACNNLLFFLQIGLLHDDSNGTIGRCKGTPTATPVLPSAQVRADVKPLIQDSTRVKALRLSVDILDFVSQWEKKRPRYPPNGASDADFQYNQATLKYEQQVGADFHRKFDSRVKATIESLDTVATPVNVEKQISICSSVSRIQEVVSCADRIAELATMRPMP